MSGTKVRMIERTGRQKFSELYRMHTLTPTPPYRKPSLFLPFANLIAAESTRHGGISPAPFQSLNLGTNTEDAPENVAENRHRFFAALGANANQLAVSHQIHGTEVLIATQPGHYNGYDALITNQTGLVVGVTVADCVPVLVYDSCTHAVVAIHAGWRGTVGGIVTRTLARMQQQFGTQPANCYAYVGTCIDVGSFEVGPEVAAQFAGSFVRTDADMQRSFVDLKAANQQQLLDFGIPVTQIEVSTYSTVLNNADYFSYRKEGGQTGRMLAVIGLTVLE